MSSLEFIKKLSAGNMVDAKEEFDNMFSNVALNALDQRKQEIAKTVFEEEVKQNKKYDKMFGKK